VASPTGKSRSVKLQARQDVVCALAGAVALGALTFLLPLADTPKPSAAARIWAYALVLACVAPILHGLFLAARGRATSSLLALGAAAAAAGVLFALISRPEDLENGPGLLILANLSRIVAAACVGILRARNVSSVGKPAHSSCGRGFGPPEHLRRAD
jgi:hypothetical protein